MAKSLNELCGFADTEPDSAPTNLVRRVEDACRKPLGQLSDEEIGTLVNQGFGFPFILDLVMPKLEENPLFYGGYYDGDVLEFLSRADEQAWQARPHYRERLPELTHRASKLASENSGV